MKSVERMSVAMAAALRGCDGLSRDRLMGINDQSDAEANLQIAPTDQGMVRLFIEADGIEIPMDFSPDEAEEIAAEIMAAIKAAQARSS